MAEADQRSIEKQSTANKLAKPCEMLRNHEDASGGLTITLAVDNGQVEMRRSHRSARRRPNRRRSRSRSSRRRSRRRSVRDTEEKYDGYVYKMTTDTEEGDSDLLTVDATSSRGGDGRAVGDFTFNIRPVVVTTMITPTQRPTETPCRPSPAVVAFSRQQTPSAETLVAADVVSGGDEKVGSRLDGQLGGRRGEEESEGEIEMVTVSSTLTEASGIADHRSTTSNSAVPDTADSTQGDAYTSSLASHPSSASI